MPVKQKALNEELSNMKKWFTVLNEENRIGIGHFPPEEQTPQFRDSVGESSELGNQPESEMSGYNLGEEEEVSDDIYEFTIPEWAVSALINDDYTGLSDEDEAKLNKFVDNISVRYGNVHFSLPKDEEMDLGFCRKNDIDSLGSNCMKLLLHATDTGKMPAKEKHAWMDGINQDLEKYDQHANKNYDDFEHGAVYENGIETDTEEEVGDVKIGMAIFSHLSDIQHHVDNETRKKINFIKSMINILADRGNVWVTNDELNGLYEKWMNKK